MSVARPSAERLDSRAPVPSDRLANLPGDSSEPPEAASRTHARIAARPGSAIRRDELDAGLAIARAAGFAWIALPAPVVAAADVIAAWPDTPAVAWSSRELALAGIGVACELRGAGERRWRDVIDAVETLRTSPAGVSRADGLAGVLGGVRVPVEALGLARPRFIGGAAFAPDAASHAPWLGFGDAWFALPRWTYVHDGAAGWLVLAVEAADAASPRWRDELATFERAFDAHGADAAQPAMLAIDRGDTVAWRAHVTAITDAIGRGDCAKIVAARSCVVSLAGDARPADLLRALDARHGDCVRVLVRPPGGGALVAATPERLVRRDGNVVSCDALAGTISRRAPDLGPDQLGSAGHLVAARSALLASTKDRREHDLVVRAIADALRSTGAEVSMPDQPGLRELRHVLHLHTPIRAELARPCHVLDLAARLHPTPAVGGTPTRVACEWIASREPAPRGWYASPVGWFDLDGNGELAVAIRSGVLVGHRVHLWAGAGIVAGSDPDRELAETDVKLRAMLGALGISA